jgi:hypothetical protein
MVPFRARILAAVPGKSLNGRIYTKELLKQTAPLYPSRGVNPRPFTLDHDIEHVERVVGLITGASYGIQEARNGRPVEGLWLEGMGYMDEQLFQKVVGSKNIPSIIRGVSIGGEGEGEFTGDGVLIRKFAPAELAMTAFPGIPMAHIAEINRIREHYLNQSDKKLKETQTFQIKETDVSLEQAEKIRSQDAKNPRRIREGPLPPADRGVNDARPGLPKPTVRSTQVHQQPQATASSTGNALMVNPEQSFAGKPRIGGKAPAGQYAKMGYSTTATPGFGKLSKSGTGLPEQESAPGSAAAAGAKGSKDAKVLKIKTPKTGATTTTHPGPGKLSPSGTGMDSEEEDTEETAIGSKSDDNPMPKKMDKTMTKNKVAAPGENPHDKNEEEESDEEGHGRASASMKEQGEEEEGEESEDEESEEEEGPEEESPEEHGPSPHIPGMPKGKVSPHSAANAYDSPADTPSEEESEEAEEHDEPHGVTPDMKAGTDSSDDRPEEEDDGVVVDPVRKVAGQGQHMRANPTKEESQPKVLFSEAEAIQATAPSLPLNPGFRATLAAMARGVGPQKAKEAASKATIEEAIKTLTRPNDVSPDEVAKLLEAWNRGKVPKEKPGQMKIWAMGKAALGGVKDLSIPDARKPVVDESVVKTKSVTAMNPGFSGASGPMISEDTIRKIWDEESKKPWSNLSYLSLAKRVYNRVVMQQLGSSS